MGPDVVAVELEPIEIETRDITSKTCACCCSTVQKVEPKPMAWAPLATLAACAGGLIGGSVGGYCAAKQVVEQPVETTDVTIVNLQASEEIVFNSVEMMSTDVAVVKAHETPGSDVSWKQSQR